MDAQSTPTTTPTTSATATATSADSSPIASPRTQGETSSSTTTTSSSLTTTPTRGENSGRSISSGAQATGGSGKIATAEWFMTMLQEFPAEFHPHLKLLPLNYMTEVILDDIPVHCEMLESLRSGKASSVRVEVSTAGENEHRIAIALADQPFLLHMISSAFASMLITVAEAHIFCTKDSFALDFFVVKSEMNTQELKDALIQTLSEEVQASRVVQTKFNQERVPMTNIIPGSSAPIIPVEEKKINFKDLDLQEKISEGYGGILWRALLKTSQQPTQVAVKLLSKEQMNNPATRTEFLNEIRILSMINHPNVVRYLGASTKPPHLFLVTEFLGGGSLYDLLHVRTAKIRLSAIRVAKDVACAMEYLHSINYVHRDLKSQNLLFDDKNQLFKVVDFGVSRTLGENMTGETGSYRWMAPEVIKHQKYSQKVDVYSFGMILWEIVAREIPFKHLTPIQAAMAVSNEGRRPKIPPTCPPDVANLIKRCWTADPSERPTFREIVSLLQGIPEAAVDPVGSVSLKQKLFGLFSNFN